MDHRHASSPDPPTPPYECTWPGPGLPLPSLAPQLRAYMHTRTAGLGRGRRNASKGRASDEKCNKCLEMAAWCLLSEAVGKIRW